MTVIEEHASKIGASPIGKFRLGYALSSLIPIIDLDEEKKDVTLEMNKKDIFLEASKKDITLVGERQR